MMKTKQRDVLRMSPLMRKLISSPRISLSSSIPIQTQAGAMLWCECLHPPPPDSRDGNLIPSVMVLGSEAFGRCSGHKGRALLNGIRVLIKEAPQSSLAPSAP